MWSDTGQLRRIPHDPTHTLRAWDAADEYVIQAWEQHGRPGTGVVINDSFGALIYALGIADEQPAAASTPRWQSWNDSVISITAAQANLRRHDLDPAMVQWVPSTEPISGPVDTVLMKIPRSLAQLEDQLHRLRPHLHPDTVMIAGAMTKQIHRSTIDTFERIIGPAPTTRAQKKARLIRPRFISSRDPGDNPYPTSYQPLPDRTTHAAGLLGWLIGRTLREDAAVFSRGRIDGGAQALLGSVSDDDPALGAGQPISVVDYGCGNGILGGVIGLANPRATITMIDESYAAVATAQRTIAAWGLTGRAQAIGGFTLDGIDDDSIDLVVCNPPFHAHRSRSDHSARAMFADAARVLRPEGHLIVVGNRHLRYDLLLRRGFDAVNVIGSDPRFVVLRATQPRR